jgi:hypothetical protein
MIMADASLRTGDRFMTENGFLIYRRAESGRISPRDFTTLTKTRNLPRAERNLLMAMEKVSLPRPSERLAAASNNSPTHVALGPPPRPLSLR